MALFDPVLHGEHAPGLCVSSAPPCCLICLFNSLSEAATTTVRRSYALRSLLDLLGEDPELLSSLQRHHAAYIIPALVHVLLHTEDPGLEQGLVALATLMCSPSSSAGPQIPELLSESLLTALVPATSDGRLSEALPAPQTHHPAILSLLASLLEVEPAAAHHAVSVLHQNPQLCHVLLSALAHCTVDACRFDSTISLLKVLSIACAQPGQGQELSAAAGLECFLQVSCLLRSVASMGPSAASGVPPSSLLQLRTACLSLLSTLASAGCCQMVSAHQYPDAAMYNHPLQPLQLNHLTAAAHQQAQQQAEELSGALMPGLRPCLLSASPALKLQAMTFVATMCGASHHVLLCRLMADDLVEYMCEGVRTTLQPHPQQQQQQQQPTGHVINSRQPVGSTAAEQADAVQASAVTALRYLSLVGPPFFDHLPFALDTLLMLGLGAVASGNTPLVADVVALITQALGPEGAGAGEAAFKGEAIQQGCIQLASSVFPAPLVPGAAPAILPAVNASAVVTGCELLSALSHHMARRNPAKRRNAAHLDALIAALSTGLNGLSSVAADSLGPYLAAAANAVHTCLQPQRVQATAPATRLAVAQAVIRHLLPGLQRVTSEGGGGEAVLPCLLSLATSLESCLLSRDGDSEGIQAQGAELCRSLWSQQWGSTCLSFMGQGEGAVKEAAWRVVLVMTQATAMEAVPDAALCGVPALTQLSTGDLQQLAGHLGWRCGGLADAVQAVALHGPCPHAPLLVALAGLHHGDTFNCDLGWLISMAAQILAISYPHSDAASLAEAERSITHAAVQLFITLEAMLSKQPQSAGQHQLHSHKWSQPTHDHLLSSVVPVVGRIISSQGSSLQLGSTLADWALAHYDVFAAAVHPSLMHWLQCASLVSPRTQLQVHSHLAQHLARSPAHIQALLAAAAHEDGQEGGGSIRHLTLLLDLLVCVLSESPQATWLLLSSGLPNITHHQLLQRRAEAARGDGAALECLRSCADLLLALTAACLTDQDSASMPAGDWVWDSLDSIASQAVSLASYCLGAGPALHSWLTSPGAQAMLAATVKALTLLMASSLLATGPGSSSALGCRLGALNSANILAALHAMLLRSDTGSGQLQECALEMLEVVYVDAALAAVGDSRGKDYDHIPGLLATQAAPWSPSPQALLEATTTAPGVLAALQRTALTASSPSSRASALSVLWAHASIAASSMQDNHPGPHTSPEACPPDVLCLLLQAGAGSSQDSSLRSTSCIGLWCLQDAWCGQQGPMMVSSESGLQGGVTTCSWGQELLRTALSQLAQTTSACGAQLSSGLLRMGDTGMSRPAEDAAPSSDSSDIPLRHCLHTLPYLLLTASALGLLPSCTSPSPPPPWVEAEFQQFLQDPSGPLQLLLSPPFLLAPLAEGVTQRLVTVGLLDSHLDVVASACRSAMCSGQPGCFPQQATHCEETGTPQQGLGSHLVASALHATICASTGSLHPHIKDFPALHVIHAKSYGRRQNEAQELYEAVLARGSGRRKMCTY